MTLWRMDERWEGDIATREKRVKKGEREREREREGGREGGGEGGREGEREREREEREREEREMGKETGTCGERYDGSRKEGMFSALTFCSCSVVGRMQAICRWLVRATACVKV